MILLAVSRQTLYLINSLLSSSMFTIFSDTNPCAHLWTIIIIIMWILIQFMCAVDYYYVRFLAYLVYHHHPSCFARFLSRFAGVFYVDEKPSGILDLLDRVVNAHQKLGEDKHLFVPHPSSSIHHICDKTPFSLSWFGWICRNMCTAPRERKIREFCNRFIHCLHDDGRLV